MHLSDRDVYGKFYRLLKLACCVSKNFNELCKLTGPWHYSMPCIEDSILSFITLPYHMTG